MSKRSRSLLGLALVMTLAAAYFAPPSGTDGVVLSERVARATSGSVPVEQPSRMAQTGTVMRSMEVLQIHTRDIEDDQENTLGVFAVLNRAPLAPKVEPPPVPVAPPPPPQVPPLPFRVLGRYVEAGQVAVFLQYNDKNIIARVGDTLGEQYKVESIDSGTLTFLYLPLNQTQTLGIGSSN